MEPFLEGTGRASGGVFCVRGGRKLRIAKEARGGQVLVSSLLKELTESAGEFAFDRGREVALKGLSGLQRVFEVAWEE